jgi:hypothetical protein
MTEHVYKVVELVGTSKTGVTDAIQTGDHPRELHPAEPALVRGGADPGRGRRTTARSTTTK